MASFVKLYVQDRCAGTLHAQLLSSQVNGTFQIDSASALGSQLQTMTGTDQAVVTIENEQILLSAWAVAGNVVTATIATNGRGYNGTSAATHAGGVSVEQHWTKAHVDNIQKWITEWDDAGLVVPTGITTIAAANQHTITGDQTAVFTQGRVLLFEVSNVWYRGVIRSSSFAMGTTTINLTGDSLPAMGTVQAAGLELSLSTRKPIDLSLVKQLSADPSDNPPAGTFWVYIQGGLLKMMNSSGTITSNTSPLTTKGDLFGFSTTNARLPVGSNNQILIADSAQALGLKWGGLASINGMSLFQSGAPATQVAHNTTNEGTMLTVSVPANTLGTTHGFHFWFFFSDVGTNMVADTITIRLKYGSTTLLTLVTKPNVGSGGSYVFEGIFLAAGATNSQKMSFSLLNPSGAAFTDAIKAGGGSSAEDSTTTLNFVVTGQASQNNAEGITLDHYVIEQF